MSNKNKNLPVDLYVINQTEVKGFSLGKRIIKKLTYWLYLPMFLVQQNINRSIIEAYNEFVTSDSRAQKSLDERLSRIECVHEKFAAAEKNIESVFAEINEQREYISSVRDNNDKLQEMISDLSNQMIRAEERDKWAGETINSLANRMLNAEERDKWAEETINSLTNRVMNAESKLQEPNNDNIFFSQSGEDQILIYVLNMLKYDLSKVTYLDLGANHAKQFSNTYSLYSRGGTGVLVEANPELIHELESERPRDIVLNRCIYEKDNEEIDFCIISGDGLSTLDKKSAEDNLEKNKDLSIKSTAKIKTITAQSILENYFDECPTIINIDLEGYEFNVLRNIDFKRYRPLMVIIEMIPYSPDLVINQKNQTIVEFMEKNDYYEYAFTGINSIFIKKDY